MKQLVKDIATRAGSIKLQTKMLVIGVLVPALIFAALLYMYSVNARDQAILASVDKARSICLAAESTRQQCESQWAMDIYSLDELRDWAEHGRDDKVLATVPIVMAWEAAKKRSEDGGYEFRVPALQPRNPENQPNPLELEAITKIKEGNLSEHHIVNHKENTVHYFRPVKLAESCLSCHGDPATSQEVWGNSDGIDVTGYAMENWEAGQMHGAFEVVQSLDEANEAASDSILVAVMSVFVCLLIAGGLTLAISKSVTKNIRVATEEIHHSVAGLRDASHSLTHDAIETSDKSTTMSAAVTELSSNISNISVAMDEIGKSVSEIALRATETSTTAESAVQEASLASEVIHRLDRSSGKINEVTDVINSLAEQTNLLALNATIEAARAGESGRGFAVVANEVKELATQTGKATQGINDAIESLREDAASAITSVERINEVINEIHAGQQTVACAVEEQNAMTQEVSRNMREMSSTSDEISGSITDVAESSKTTTDRVEESVDLIRQIERVSEELPTLIGLDSKEYN